MKKLIGYFDVDHVICENPSYGVIIIRWDVSLKKTLCLILIIAPMAMLSQ